jgi:DNA segregation ATPase FtsK/SpoIIIE-like protein
LQQQWQGTGLPLGMGTNGLLIADPETYPHLLMAGTSGSGKTRFGLRPLIASALTSGWQVAIYDRSGLDFLPFQGHANAHTVLLEEPTQATEHLSLLYEMIQERFITLRQAGVSTWGRLLSRGAEGQRSRGEYGLENGSFSSAPPHPFTPSSSPGPRILAVVDEFANLADGLPDSQRKELWRAARMIAAEGRKAGVHQALALQDPTHKSLDLRIRRNCLPLSFRVKDGDASRVILGAGGAEQLQPRQFMTVMNQLIRGVAFAPSDEEIGNFLAARPVAAHPIPIWLEAGGTTTAIPAPDATEERIRSLLGQGRSLRAVQRELFGYTGGAAYEAVKAVHEQMRLH